MSKIVGISGKITAPNYLGSKLRVLDEILSIILPETRENEYICDLFSGSGTVTAALSDYRPVIAVDIQNYSNEFIKGFSSPIKTLDKNRFLNDIDNEFVRLSSSLNELLIYEDRLLSSADYVDELANFIENASFVKYNEGIANSSYFQLDSIMLESIQNIGKREVKVKDIVATWNFGGTYFSYGQSLFIDSVLNVIRKHELDNIKSTVLSLACVIVNTIGKQFAQPINPRDKKGLVKKSLFKKASKDRGIEPKVIYEGILDSYLNQIPSKYDVKSWCMDFKEALENLPKEVSIIYADPPYTRDHYSRFYHVLETLSLEDIPNISRVKKNGSMHISKGLYREDRHQSPFCIKSQAPIAFDNLFRLAAKKEINVLLSYSPFEREEHPRVMTIDRILDIAQQYFSSYEQFTVGGFKHNKLNSNANKLDRSLPGELFILFKNPRPVEP